MKQNEDKWKSILELLEPEPPKYCPENPTVKQKLLLKYDGLEALFGGSGGGGKSSALLMAALQYVHIPGYAAIIFRNTYSDLSLPGAIMDRSHDWLDMCEDARWKDTTATWHFKSGATLSFGYLDKPKDHYRYKSAEFCYIGFDEVTEIRKEQYQYLFSRLRKPSALLGSELAKVPLRVRAASNPAPNWVRDRFIVDKHDDRIYIPAGLIDNPFVDREAYLKSLEQVDPIERARMRDGDWYAEAEGSLFDRDDFKIITSDQVPREAYLPQNICRAWDIAATEVSENNSDPDWTAGALVSIVDGYMIIHNMRHFREASVKLERKIQRTAAEDGPAVAIRMEQEPGASGKLTISHFARHVLNGYNFDGHPAVKNKEARANLWAPKVRRGEVLLVDGPWITEFIDEAISFGAINIDVHDDQIDAVSAAFEHLTGMSGPKGRSRIDIIV